jgi:hypothetical protein
VATCTAIQISTIAPAVKALARAMWARANTVIAAIRNDPPTTMKSIRLGTE